MKAEDLALINKIILFNEFTFQEVHSLLLKLATSKKEPFKEKLQMAFEELVLEPQKAE